MLAHHDTRETTRAGFTLLELMITVGLIGILAAAAIPNFVNYQARARATEAYANLAALARAQLAYQAETDVFLDIGVTGEPSLPDFTIYGGLGLSKMPWDAATSAFFDQVGWAPEGQVHYTYETVAGDGVICSLCFTLAAHGDADGDTQIGSVVYVHPELDANGNFLPTMRTYFGALGVPTNPTTGAPIYDEPGRYIAGRDDY